MPAVKPKSFAYSVEVDDERRIAPGGGEFVALGEEWSADHLLLAAVVRCSIASLRFHARRRAIEVTATGRGRGTVTRPDGEERFRFVELEAEIDATLDPPQEGAALEELLALAERDCFVGASLLAKPRYRWRVEGVEP